MTETARDLPQKTRDLHNHHMDSTIWDGFVFRDNDIVIATYAKSGTTWMQQIVSQLIFNGKEGLPVAEMSPWLDNRVVPREVKHEMLERQTHRRFIKTHLPVDALVFSPNAKYLYVGRDGRDVLWSLYNHHANANEIYYDRLNNAPGLIGPRFGPPAASERQYFREWLDGDGYPFWSFWENVRSWWAIRDLPNVMLIHFAQLKADMPGEIGRIAEFLDIPIIDEKWHDIVEHCSFEYMKAHAADSVPAGGALWEGGAATFVNKGTNGRWRDILTPQDIADYEARAVAELGPAAARWLATGAE